MVNGYRYLDKRNKKQPKHRDFKQTDHRKKWENNKLSFEQLKQLANKIVDNQNY